MEFNADGVKAVVLEDTYDGIVTKRKTETAIDAAKAAQTHIEVSTSAVTLMLTFSSHILCWRCQLTFPQLFVFITPFHCSTVSPCHTGSQP